MHINRLNLIFPPTTPGSAAGVDVLSQQDTGKARAPVARPATVPVRKAAEVAPNPPAEPTAAPAGVTLELDSGQKTAASGVYTRDGVVTRRASAAVDQTPAEQFVASAVNILRDFDVNKASSGGASAANSAAQALPASRFGGFKQAVAKLNVFA